MELTPKTIGVRRQTLKLSLIGSLVLTAGLTGPTPRADAQAVESSTMLQLQQMVDNLGYSAKYDSTWNGFYFYM